VSRGLWQTSFVKACRIFPQHHFFLIQNMTESPGIVCVLDADNHTHAPDALPQFKTNAMCSYPHAAWRARQRRLDTVIEGGWRGGREDI
jgi:hypothetical protein